MPPRGSPLRQSDLNRIAKAARAAGMTGEIDPVSGVVRFIPWTDRPRQSADQDAAAAEIERLLGNG